MPENSAEIIPNLTNNVFVKLNVENLSNLKIFTTI